MVYSYTVPTGGYDGVGNLLKYSDNSAKGPIMGTWTFSYDNLNRVAGSTDTQPGNPSTNYCWSYDSFGNRTTQAGSNQPFATGFSGTPATNPCTPASSASLANTSASYSALNRMSGSTQVPAGVPYDASGDVLNDGATQYLYDAEGRVCASANTPAPGFATMTGYIYDADGLRVAKGTISLWSCDPGVSGFATISDYVLGPGGEQVAEYGAGPSSGSAPGAMAWQHSNVWAAGKLLATYDKDGLHFYLDDPLGSRRVQTDFAGATEQTCASLPFGDALSCSGSTQFPTEHHFTGKERDTESGLDNFGARYYGSSMGRFMSPDPSGLLAQHPENPQSWNLYAYALNNPLKNIDPTGLDCVYANDAGNGVESIDHDSNSGECGSNGGTWAPGYVDENWAHFNQNTNMFQVGSVDGAGSSATVDYTNFQSGAQTDANGNCLSGCGGYGFASANADWLQGQLVGNSQLSGLDGYIQFLTGREQQLSTFSQFAFGPLDPSQNNWAGPGGMGPPQGTGDWRASMHDYNFNTNGITIGSYFNPSLSPATSRALIQSNSYLMQTGGYQGAKEKLFFGVVNAFQRATHIF